MNRTFIIIFIILISFNLVQKSYSLGLPMFKKGDIISGELNFGKRLKIPLPPGNWTVVNVGGGILAKSINWRYINLE